MIEVWTSAGPRTVEVGVVPHGGGNGSKVEGAAGADLRALGKVYSRSAVISDAKTRCTKYPR